MQTKMTNVFKKQNRPKKHEKMFKKSHFLCRFYDLFYAVFGMLLYNFIGVIWNVFNFSKNTTQTPKTTKKINK